MDVSKRGWWLSGSAVLVVSLFGGLAFALARFDPNSLKPTLIAAAQNATGRTLHLDGDITLRPSLWPTIEVDTVSLDNLPGGSRPDMVRAERVIVALSLPALLQHRIEVSALTLIGPNILFEQVNGAANWRLDLPAQPGTAPAGTADTGTPARPFGLDIQNAHVQNGMVTWHLPARTKVLGIRTMDVEHHAAGGPVTFAGTFVYADNQPFRLTGSALPTAGLADPWTTRLDLAAFDTTASATGQMTTAGIYDFQVEASSGSLDKLNALLPEMRLPPLHGMTLSSRLTNGRRPGDLPVIGATRLHVADGDLGGMVPGLRLAGFDVTVDKPGGTATVAGSGQFRTQGFNLGGTVGVPRYPDDRLEVPLDLELKAPPRGTQASGRLGLKGTVTVRALAFAGLDATAALSTPALAALRPLVSPGLPALTDLQLDGHLVLPPSLNPVTFSAARLSSRQGDLAGDGVVGFGPALTLNGKLHATTLDLSAMLAAFGFDPSPPQLGQTAGGPLISDAPLPWEVIRGPTLDLMARADQLRFLDETWQGVDLALQLKGGHLERGTLSVVSGGSPVSVSLTADARRPAVPVELRVDAPALPLSLVARYAGLPGPVAGTARVQAQVAGSGRSLHAMAETLTGTASLAAVGGQLRNDAFVQLTSASLDALGIKVPAQGETALRCLGVGAAFRNGVGQISPIALETTYLSLDGEGQVDLGRETVSLQLKPLAALSGSSVSVPVVVEGPFRHLAGRLDAGLLDKLGLVVDAWFGGDRSTACVDAGLVRPPKR